MKQANKQTNKQTKNAIQYGKLKDEYHGLQVLAKGNQCLILKRDSRS
jgi:hypothetical protein